MMTRPMEPIIDHLQITVKDMSVAVPFYDKLLPLLGFDPKRRASAVIEEHEFHVVEQGEVGSRGRRAGQGSGRRSGIFRTSR